MPDVPGASTFAGSNLSLGPARGWLTRGQPALVRSSPFALTTMPPKAAPFVVPDLKTGTNAELVEYSAELKRVIGDLDERSKSTGRPSEKLQPLIERRKQVERELNRRQRAERLDEDVNDAIQILVEANDPRPDIVQFELSTLFAGVINAGINAC